MTTLLIACSSCGTSCSLRRAKRKPAQYTYRVFMNQKDKMVTVFALILTCLLLVSIQTIKADTIGPLRFKDGVTVYSPVSATYNSKNILFNYTFSCGMGMHYILNYALDGNIAAPMPYQVINPKELHVVYLAVGQVQLPELSEGTHTLTISLQATFGQNDVRSYIDSIQFTIDTNAPDFTLDTIPPNIVIQSPKTNQTYTAPVPLNFYLSEPVNQLTLHLDGNKTTLPTQNTTLTGLTTGTHTLTLTTVDFAGNPGYTYYITFNVIQPTPTSNSMIIGTATPTPSSSPLPTPSVPELSILVILPFFVSVLLVAVYLKIEGVSMNNKNLVIVLILIMAISSLSPIAIKPVFAQTISKPSIPEFTLELVGPSFDIPPTYYFNSSSGLFNVNEGYHFQFSTVNINIKNQPFTNQSNIDFLHYNVRIKLHNYPDSYWQELFSAGADGYPIQTPSDYTIIPLIVEGTQALGVPLSVGATTDIQIEAMIGHIGRNNTMTPYPYQYIFIGETSGWSNTQTVTLPPKTPITLSFPNANSYNYRVLLVDDFALVPFNIICYSFI